MSRRDRQGNGRIEMPVGIGGPQMQVVQQLPSVQQVAEQGISCGHIDAPWSMPVGLQTQCRDGLFVRAVGGYTKIEQGALMIAAANPSMAAVECRERAKEILAACQPEATATASQEQSPAVESSLLLK